VAHGLRPGIDTPVSGDATRLVQIPACYNYTKLGHDGHLASAIVVVGVVKSGSGVSKVLIDSVRRDITSFGLAPIDCMTAFDFVLVGI
jgi:hypothetical protein